MTHACRKRAAGLCRCGNRRATWVGQQGKSPGEQAWMIRGGTPAGSAEQLVSAGTILAETRREIFSKRQIAFAIARRRQGRRLIPSYGTAPRCSLVPAHREA